MTEPDKQTRPKEPYVQPSLAKSQQLKEITEGDVMVVFSGAE